MREQPKESDFFKSVEVKINKINLKLLTINTVDRSLKSWHSFLMNSMTQSVFVKRI